MSRILVLHGPNLQLLGTREPDLYGKKTLDEINQLLMQSAKTYQVDLICLQSNRESELLDVIASAPEKKIEMIIFNPAAFTHTSIALRDVLLAVGIPFIEVHLSNIYKRESFRHHSYFSDIAVGSITGFGAFGYELALQAALCQLKIS